MNSRYDVAVVIPIYGDAKYVKDSVLSCFENSGPSIQVILVLDRATKDVCDFLHSLQTEYSDIKVLISGEPGISAALNLGISKAESDLVARLDSDDTMSSDRLEIQVNFMEKNPQIDVCGSQVIHIDEDSHPLRKSHYPENPKEISSRLKYTNALAHSSVIFRRQSFILAGGYRSRFDGAEDYDLWLRIENKKNIINLPLYLTSFRVHPQQSAQNTPERSVILASKIRLENVEISRDLRVDIEAAIGFSPYLAAIKMAHKRTEGAVKQCLSKEVVKLNYSMLLRAGLQKPLLRSFLNFLKTTLICLRYNKWETLSISRNAVANYSRTQFSGLSKTLIFGRRFDKCA